MAFEKDRLNTIKKAPRAVSNTNSRLILLFETTDEDAISV